MIFYATIFLFLMMAIGLGLVLPPAPNKRRRVERGAMIIGAVLAGASFLMHSYSASLPDRPAYLPEYFGIIGIGGIIISAFFILVPLAIVGIAWLKKH